MKIEWWKLARRSVLVAIAACCVVGLTGCGGDDDGEDANVVGSWELRADSGSDDNDYDTFVFNANGTLSLPGDDDEIISSSYQVSGNSITATWTASDGIETWTVTITGTVDGDTMSGTWSDSDGGGGTWSGYRN